MMALWIGLRADMYHGLGRWSRSTHPLRERCQAWLGRCWVCTDHGRSSRRRDRAAQTGQQIKGFHSTIKGCRSDGRRYHATEPRGHSYWAHATFSCGDQGADYLAPADRGDKAPAVSSTSVYAQYGMIMRRSEGVGGV